MGRKQISIELPRGGGGQTRFKGGKCPPPPLKETLVYINVVKFEMLVFFNDTFVCEFKHIHVHCSFSSTAAVTLWIFFQLSL